MGNTTSPPTGGRRQILAVYRDPEAATAGADAAESAGATLVRVNREADDVLALQAEMRSEMDSSMSLPASVGPLPKESARGLAMAVPIGFVIGALVALPIGFIEFGLPVAQRLVIAAVVGGFFGAASGLVIGGGAGARGPAAPLAAEEGITVVAVASEDKVRAVEDAMRSAAKVIRMDVVIGGQPVATITESDESAAHQAGRKVGQTEGDWSQVRDHG